MEMIGSKKASTTRVDLMTSIVFLARWERRIIQGRLLVGGYDLVLILFYVNILCSIMQILLYDA